MIDHMEVTWDIFEVEFVAYFQFKGVENFFDLLALIYRANLLISH